MTTRHDSVLAWRDVSVERGDRRVIDMVNLRVERGQWLAIVGPNGAGKTSLIRTIVDQPTSGTVELEGEPIRALSPGRRARSVAFVPQHPVIPAALRVFDYVLLGRTPHHGLRYSASESDRRKTQAVLQRLELDNLANRALESLSGGERQRAVLARALTQEAPLLVLDEPTTFLDVGHQFAVLELIAALRRERSCTVITTVHDLSLAGQFADVAAVLHDGKLLAAGRPSEVLTSELIERAWGVQATTESTPDGVVVTIRRRREATQGATSPATEVQ